MANSHRDAGRLTTTTYRRLTRLFIFLMLAGCLAGIIVPAGLGWDFANFYDAGRRIAAGQSEDLFDAARLIDGAAPQGTMYFWGTPISAFLYVPLSWFPAETALVLFKIQNVLAFAAAFGVLFAFCQAFLPDSRSARSEFAAVFAFLCLIYQPFWTVFRVGGQTTPTVFLLLALGIVLHTHARFWGSALCVVVATLIKPAVAPALLFLLCVSGLSFLRKTVVILSVVGLTSLALLGWPVHLAFLTFVRGGVQSTYPWYYNSSLYILVDNLRTAVGSQADAGVYRLLLAGLTYGVKATVLATVVFLTVKSRAQGWSDAARRHFDFVMAILFFLLWSLTVWEHYLAVLFIPLVYVVAAREYFSRRALVIVGSIFVLSLGQNLILTDLLRSRLTFDSLVALLGIALFKSGPLLLTLVFLLRHHAELFRSYAAPAWERPPRIVLGRPHS
jgi:hypothetical protein